MHMHQPSGCGIWEELKSNCVAQSGSCVQLLSRFAFDFINPRRACAARVTVLGLCVCVCACVCVCVCYSTSHFSRVYSYHKRY